jgi:protein-disulfide isomerase
VVEHITAVQGQVSICNVNATFDCDKVNTSAYSMMFGLPVALFGFAFYAALGVVALLGRLRAGSHPHAHRVLRIGGGWALLFTLYMVWASTQVGAWCLFCMSLYGFNLMLLVGSWIAVARADRDAGPTVARPSLVNVLLGGSGDRSTLTAVIVGAVSLAAGILVFQALRGDGGKGAPVSTALSEELVTLYSEVQGTVDLDGSEPILGKSDAPFLIVEFADFACPYCSIASQDFKDLVRRNPSVQLRFKHYPISGICNKYVKGARHATACEASYAADCAQRQSRFWEYASLLFKNQEYQKSEDLRFMAQQVGLDMAAFEACMTDPVVKAGIDADIEAARKAQLRGTPSFYVKGLYGADFVQVRAKADAVETLIKAVQSGTALLPPRPPKAE